MTTAKSLSILLVNYKTRHMTSVCLALIKQHLDLSKADVIVVDNYSGDESLAYLRSLDWIKLIERKRPVITEPPHMAHAKALDLGMDYISTDFVLLLHTDTLIYSSKIIDYLFKNLLGSPNTAAVGSVDQRYRNRFRKAWRLSRKTIRYAKSKIQALFGPPGMKVKPIYDAYLKSYCCLWDARIIRKNGLNFFMGDKNPSYGMQDKLARLGYRFERLPTKAIFGFLDHIQSGTVVENQQTRTSKRRKFAYENLLLGQKTSQTAFSNSIRPPAPISESKQFPLDVPL